MARKISLFFALFFLFGPSAGFPAGSWLKEIDPAETYSFVAGEKVITLRVGEKIIFRGAKFRLERGDCLGVSSRGELSAIRPGEGSIVIYFSNDRIGYEQPVKVVGVGKRR